MNAVDAASIALRRLKAERNFISFPFFALSNRDAARRKKAEITVEFRDQEGKLQQSRGRVLTAEDYTYPTPFDKKVHKAIEYLITRRGLPIENPFPFTAYEVLKLLDMKPHSGANVAKVRESIKRITATTIEGERVIFSKGKNRQIRGRVFRIFNDYAYSGDEDADGNAMQRNAVELSEWYLDNIARNHVRPLDFVYYKTLGNDAVACRLYELVGLPFYGIFMNKSRGAWRRSYITYAYNGLCVQLPLTPERYWSRAQRQLSPAHTRLQETGFLGKVEWSRNKDAWEIQYFPGQRAVDEFAQFRGRFEELDQLEMPLPQSSGALRRLETPQSAVEGLDDARGQESPKARAECKNETPTGFPEPDTTTALAHQLIERKIKPAAAARLAKKYPGRICRNVEVFDFLLQNPDHGIKNPPAYLVRAIEENWFLTNLPEGFVSREEQEDERLRKQEAGEELLSEYQNDLEKLLTWLDEWSSLPPEKRINFDVLNQWITDFRCRHKRSPTDKEQARRVEHMMQRLLPSEKMRTQEISVLQADYEARAAKQGNPERAFTEPQQSDRSMGINPDPCQKPHL